MSNSVNLIELIVVAIIAQR